MSNLNRFAVLSNISDKKDIKNSNNNKINYMINIDETNNNINEKINNIWNNKNKNILKILKSKNYKEKNEQNMYLNIKYKNKKKNIINDNIKEKICKNRILCFNVLNSTECSYSNKCLYAHSLEEQIIDKNRKNALDLLQITDLKNINLIEDVNLRENILVLTKLCSDCINKVCPGGYNCKYGACNKDVLICNTDFLKGDCKNVIENNKCINGYHLTLHNLIPLVKQQLLIDYPNNQLLVEKNMEKNTLDNDKKIVNGFRFINSTINLNNTNNTNTNNKNKFNILYESDMSSDEDILEF
jgi:hypothetical protein